MKKQHIDNLQELRSDNNQQKLRSNNEDTQQEQRSKNNDNDTNRHSTREQRPPSDPLSNIGSTSGKSYRNGFQFMSLKKPLTHKMCFNQMHASKGIEGFKEHAVAALFKEYKQLNDMSKN